MEKIVKILIAADIVLSLAVIAIIILLNSFIRMDNNRDAQLRVATPDKNLAQKIATVKPKVIQSKNVEIALSDEKIDPSGFLVYTNENVTLNIINGSKVARDFKIEKLNFDSGDIKPGETKKASLGLLPEEQGTYEYKSAATDGSQELTGTLIVLVKQ